MRWLAPAVRPRASEGAGRQSESRRSVMGVVADRDARPPTGSLAGRSRSRNSGRHIPAATTMDTRAISAMFRTRVEVFMPKPYASKVRGWQCHRHFLASGKAPFTRSRMRRPPESVDPDGGRARFA
jgi:hypothetical protein